jgi:hypothetical protein
VGKAIVAKSKSAAGVIFLMLFIFSLLLVQQILD